jgi:hypothetical protein
VARAAGPEGHDLAARRQRGRERPARRLLRLREAARRPAGHRPHGVGQLRLQLLRGDHLQPQQRARPALALHLPVDGPAVQGRDGRARRRDAVHQRPRRHDRQRRPGHDVGLVRLLVARPVPDDERRQLLRRVLAAVPGGQGPDRRVRPSGRHAHHLGARRERGQPLHPDGPARRQGVHAHLPAPERDRARRPHRLRARHAAGELGHRPRRHPAVRERRRPVQGHRPLRPALARPGARAAVEREGADHAAQPRPRGDHRRKGRRLGHDGPRARSRPSSRTGCPRAPASRSPSRFPRARRRATTR